MRSLKEKLTEAPYDNQFSLKLIEAEHHFSNIFKECQNTFEEGTGSYLFDGKIYEYCIDMYFKQKLLYETSSKASNILEVGTYMGHSILIMLLANPSACITCIDINDKYSAPAINYLKKKFPHSKINFIKGDSLNVLPSLTERFDFFHIDGAHLNHIIAKEFIHCTKLSKYKNFRMILDDIDSCLKVKKNIKLSFSNSIFEIPASNWKNCYIKIDFSSSANEHNTKISKFNKLSNIDYLKVLPSMFFKKIRRFPKKIIKSLIN
tara:strand:+ start:195 stop:983 length:789 start_codon:yes stop_codon:yes gene_type:complete